MRKTFTSFTVKVQRAVVPKEGPGLIYDQAQTHVTQQKLSRRVLEAMGDDLKGFFNAAWDGSQWHIGARIKSKTEW